MGYDEDDPRGAAMHANLNAGVYRAPPGTPASRLVEASKFRAGAMPPEFGLKGIGKERTS